MPAATRARAAARLPRQPTIGFTREDDAVAEGDAPVLDVAAPAERALDAPGASGPTCAWAPHQPTGREPMASILTVEAARRVARRDGELARCSGLAALGRGEARTEARRLSSSAPARGVGVSTTTRSPGSTVEPWR